LNKSDEKFRQYFYSHFQYIPEEEEFAEHEIQKPDIIRVLEENKNIKFFKDDQKIIAKKFFGVLLSSSVANDRNMGFNVISKIIDNNNIPFEIKSIKETKGQNRDKKYWMFIRKQEEVKNENN